MEAKDEGEIYKRFVSFQNTQNNVYIRALLSPSHAQNPFLLARLVRDSFYGRYALWPAAFFRSRIYPIFVWLYEH